MITPLPGIQLVNHPPGKAFALPLVQWLAQGQPTWLYFTSTTAPASVNFFLMFSASSLETPSLIGLGAPSTRSLASFRPRLVTSRTALMTLILFAPTSFSMTLNSVFSSAGAAPAAAPAPPPAMTTGAAAAAETPKRSSSFFTSCAASSSDNPTICSSNCCKSAIAISILRYQFCCSVPCARFPVRSRTLLRQTRGRNPDRNPWHLITKCLRSGGFFAGELVLLHALVHHHRQV